MTTTETLLRALHTIDANAAESPEWIRRVAREAIEQARAAEIPDLLPAAIRVCEVLARRLEYVHAEESENRALARCRQAIAAAKSGQVTAPAADDRAEILAALREVYEAIVNGNVYQEYEETCVMLSRVRVLIAKAETQSYTVPHLVGVPT